MVIERYKPGMTEQVYERYDKSGRMLPEGLVYLDSWLSEDRTTCFQLMETDGIDEVVIVNNGQDATYQGQIGDRLVWRKMS